MGETPQPAPEPRKRAHRGRRCPRCGENSAHRSGVRTMREQLATALLLARPYSCHRCGWRGWRPRWWKGAARYEVPTGPSDAELRRRRRARRKKERDKLRITPRRRLASQVALALALGALAGAFFYFWYGGGGD